MRVVLILALALAISPFAYSATLEVPGSYATIQGAINSATAGDLVSVAPGTYLENIDFLGKAITIQSTDGAEFTVIDGQMIASVVSFVNGEGSDSVLDGFKLTNGFSDYGGGVYCDLASPTISNNLISNNSAYHDGGGVYGYDTNAQLLSNTLRSNLAANGGGVFVGGTSAPTLDGNTITGNDADIYFGFGGGICCDCDSGSLMNNTITGNDAAGGGGIYTSGTLTDITGNEISWNAGIAGGGIYCAYQAAPTISTNTFEENTANEGGGIFCYYSTATIDDNTIINNVVTFGGGGISCYDLPPTITNNTVMGNSAAWGGGIDCNSCSPTFADNMVKENTAVEEGGGIYCNGTASPTVEGNTVIDNSVVNANGYGGGICCVGESATVTGNTVQGNNAGIGGGVYIYANDTATLMNNTIKSNNSDQGAGAYVYGPTGMIKGNAIDDNTATAEGGGLYIDCETLDVINNTLDGNASVSGGGIYCYDATANVINNILADNSATSGAGLHLVSCNSTLINNTFGGNAASETGGGLSCTQTFADVYNTIAWGNTATDGPQIWLGSEEEPSTLTIDYSVIEGGENNVEVVGDSDLEWGENMSVDDPLFVDADDHDYHITYDSPCRDAGQDYINDEEFDFEGDPREAFSDIDIGADEYHAHFYCTGDFTPGGAVKGKLLGLPDATPTGIFFGSGLYETPLPTKWGDYYLEAPWLVVGLGALPANGAMIIETNLPATPTASYDVFMQALIGLDSDSFTNVFVMKVR